MPVWPLLLSNAYHCTTGDSRCSTHCSTVLHLFLMSNSHPLRPLFTMFEPVAHQLLPIVVAMVPLFFPTVLEAVPSDWNIHFLHGLKHSPAICNSASNLLKPAANIAIARAARYDGCRRRHLLGGGSVGAPKRWRICGVRELSNAGDYSTTKQEEVKRSHNARRQRRRGLR